MKLFTINTSAQVGGEERQKRNEIKMKERMIFLSFIFLQNFRIQIPFVLL